MVLENRVLRKALTGKRYEIISYLRKWHNTEPRDLNSTPSVGYINKINDNEKGAGNV
jgi:hypothetical protein